jgi:Flp pilus assembly pilin Flp
MKRIRISKRQLGQGMTEYIIIVALIAVGAVGVYTAFGKMIQHEVSSIALGVTGSSSAAGETTAANTSATNAQTAAAKAQGMQNYTQESADSTLQK